MYLVQWIKNLRWTGSLFNKRKIDKNSLTRFRHSFKLFHEWFSWPLFCPWLFILVSLPLPWVQLFYRRLQTLFLFSRFHRRRVFLWNLFYLPKSPINCFFEFGSVFWEVRFNVPSVFCKYGSEYIKVTLPKLLQVQISVGSPLPNRLPTTTFALNVPVGNFGPFTFVVVTLNHHLLRGSSVSLP